MAGIAFAKVLVVSTVDAVVDALIQPSAIHIIDRNQEGIEQALDPCNRPIFRLRSSVATLNFSQRDVILFGPGVIAVVVRTALMVVFEASGFFKSAYIRSAVVIRLDVN